MADLFLACHLLLGLSAKKHTCPTYKICRLAMIELCFGWMCVCDSGAGVGEHLWEGSSVVISGWLVNWYVSLKYPTPSPIVSHNSPLSSLGPNSLPHKTEPSWIFVHNVCPPTNSLKSLLNSWSHNFFINWLIFLKFGTLLTWFKVYSTPNFI